MPKQTDDKLYRVLTELEAHMEKQNSLSRAFLFGLIRGFGAALGATVLFALATSLVFQLSSTLNLDDVTEFISEDVAPD